MRKREVNRLAVRVMFNLLNDHAGDGWLWLHLWQSLGEPITDTDAQAVMDAMNRRITALGMQCGAIAPQTQQEN